MKILIFLVVMAVLTACAGPGDDGGSSKNKVLNGSMRFDRRRQGLPFTAGYTEHYSLEQWRVAGAADGEFIIERVQSDAPGFDYALRATVTRQQTVHTGIDNHHIEYPIEGRYIADLAFGTARAQTVTLSFLVRASKAGVKPFALMNGENSRSIVSSFEVLQSDEWEEKILTFTGDTVGRWQTQDGTFGLKLLWSLGVGSTYSRTTTGTWMPGAAWNLVGADQLLEQPVGSTLEITGVQFEVGSDATSYDYLSYGEELARLERYLSGNADGTFTSRELGGP